MTIPAVYVTIEDQSVVLPGIASDRTVFCTILGDRGPHNRVVELTSVSQFYKLFGKPNIDRTGYGHYQVDKALQMGARAYVVRAAKLDSDTEENNAAMANAAIKFNDLSGSFQTVNGRFLFSNEDDVHSELMAKRVYVDVPGFDQFAIGDLIISEEDGETPPFARKIVSKHQDNGYNYFMLEEAYEGTSTDDDALNLLYHGNVLPVDFSNGEEYSFIEKSDVVVCNGGQIAQDAITVGDWVFPTSGNLRNARKVASKPTQHAAQTQVQKIYVNDNTNDFLNSRHFLLNSPATAPGDITEYYVWFNVTNSGIDPAPVGKTGIEVNILSGDDDIAVTIAINTALTTNTDFDASFVNNEITITNVKSGQCDIIDDEGGTGFISDI